MGAFDHFNDNDDWGVLWDIQQAFGVAELDTRIVFPEDRKVDPISLDDVAEVTDWYVSYHGSEWRKPGDPTGTELDLVMVMRLHDGRWAVLFGWNDYTGWGCQDGASIRIGASKDEVVRFGLDKDERERLGLTLESADV